ncbi:probable 28S ribosomal protein S25, mitochondrial [Apis dorsata]|uniref:probable 28S ribosomal protein S25, mitochondrial n=1 Tax=Apis dorsata TaxID=7462 RepID=UPI0003DF7BAC|nr:probable 28S ribosomal protein S25, mitochondrial [Apis dorsata]
MPFMIGQAPIRRTLNYLKAGKLILKDEIQILILFQSFTENGNTMLIDLDSKSKEDILFHLQIVIGKAKHILQQENIMQEKKDNSANFGVGCHRSCICVIPGQIPCPAIVPLPYHMRGKYKKSLKEP